MRASVSQVALELAAGSSFQIGPAHHRKHEARGCGTLCLFQGMFAIPDWFLSRSRSPWQKAWGWVRVHIGVTGEQSGLFAF